MVGLRSKAIRTVLRWQLLATALLSAVAGLVSGKNGFVSAALGGLVSLLASLAFATVASLSPTGSAGTAMVGALRAEAAKIISIVLLLWLVLTNYKSVVFIAFFGTFFAATVLFSAAAFVRED